MAVHLNAGLRTRYIPILFSVALVVSFVVSRAHASTDSLPSSDEVPSLAGVDPESVMRDEIRNVMAEGTDPNRNDRRPGFSTMIVAPRVGEGKSVGDLTTLNEEEPTPRGVSSSVSRYLDFSDDIPTQASEAYAE